MDEHTEMIEQRAEVVERIVTYWTQRLELDGMSYTDDDAPGAVAAVIAAMFEESTLRSARPEVSLGFAVTAGIEIAVAAMDDPLADHRPVILQSLKTLRTQIQYDAKASRADAAAS